MPTELGHELFVNFKATYFERHDIKIIKKLIQNYNLLTERKVHFRQRLTMIIYINVIKQSIVNTDSYILDNDSSIYLSKTQMEINWMVIEM